MVVNRQRPRARPTYGCILWRRADRVAVETLPPADLQRG